jgi:hypothetical protein
VVAGSIQILPLRNAARLAALSIAVPLHLGVATALWRAVLPELVGIGRKQSVTLRATTLSPSASQQPEVVVEVVPLPEIFVLGGS